MDYRENQHPNDVNICLWSDEHYCLLQGKPLASMRQENVLDMMRKWRTEQEFREEDIPDHVEAAAGASIY